MEGVDKEEVAVVDLFESSDDSARVNTQTAPEVSSQSSDEMGKNVSKFSSIDENFNVEKPGEKLEKPEEEKNEVEKEDREKTPEKKTVEAEMEERETQKESESVEQISEKEEETHKENETVETIMEVEEREKEGEMAEQLPEVTEEPKIQETVETMEPGEVPAEETPEKRKKLDQTPEKRVNFAIPEKQEEKISTNLDESREQLETSPEEIKTPEKRKRKMKEKKTVDSTPPATTTTPPSRQGLRDRSEIHKPKLYEAEAILPTRKSYPRRTRPRRKLQLKEEVTPPPSTKALSLKTFPEGSKDCLRGLSFVITGSLPSFPREPVIKFIQQYGGRVTKDVSSKTSVLIVGNDPGEAKIRKAKDFGVSMLSEDEFLDLVRSSNESLQPQAA